MNFLGVGPAELLVILVVALIFVGPERLPRLAADIARTIRELRKYTSSIAAEFTEVIEDIERETKDDRSQWKEIGEGLTDATKSVATALRDARAEGLRIDDVPGKARALFAFMEGVLSQARIGDDPKLIRDLRKSAFAFLGIDAVAAA